MFTLAPLCRSCLPYWRPIPLAPPVIKATLSFTGSVEGMEASTSLVVVVVVSVKFWAVVALYCLRVSVGFWWLYNKKE